MRLKLMPLLVAGVVLSATTARATPSRVLGLGDLGRYVEDDSNVLMYPGLIQKYAHFMYVDLGGPTGLQNSLNDSIASGLTGGAFVKLSDDLQLGVATSSFSPFEQSSFLSTVGSNAAAANGGAFGTLAGMNSLRRYDFLLGYSLAKDAGLGLRVSYGSETKTYVPDPTEKTADPVDGTRKNDSQAVRQFQATVGFSGNLSRDFGLDTALDFTNHSLGYAINEKDAIDSYSGIGFGASVRARLALTKWWSLIPALTYRGSFFSLEESKSIPAFGTVAGAVEPKALDANELRKHSAAMHNLDLGAVAALKASKVATFWIGGGFQMTRMSYSGAYTSDAIDQTLDITRTQYALPYVKFAFEMQPTDWIKFRAGAEKYTYSSTNYRFDVDNKKTREEGKFAERTTSGTGGINYATGAIDPAAKDFAAYLGVSAFTQNGLTFDFLLDNELLRSGLSGLFVNKMALRGAVSYKF